MNCVINPARAIKKTAKAVATTFSAVNEPPNPVSARILTRTSKAALTCSRLSGIFGRNLPGFACDAVVSVCCSLIDAGVVAAESVVAVCAMTLSGELPVAVARVTGGNAESTGTVVLIEVLEGSAGVKAGAAGPAVPRTGSTLDKLD